MRREKCIFHLWIIFKIMGATRIRCLKNYKFSATYCSKTILPDATPSCYNIDAGFRFSEMGLFSLRYELCNEKKIFPVQRNILLKNDKRIIS